VVLVAAGAFASVVVWSRQRRIDRTDTASPAPTCPDPPDDGDTDCHRCRNARCCGEYLASRASAASADYKVCIGACNDNRCRDACNGRYPDGHAAFAPLYACANDQCLTQCGGANAKDTCVGCQFLSCRNEAFACYGDPGCDTMYTCDDICGDGNDACRQECLKRAPGPSRQRVYLLESCTRLNCKTTCGD
jgi:hypothetical protein